MTPNKFGERKKKLKSYQNKLLECLYIGYKAFATEIDVLLSWRIVDALVLIITITKKNKQIGDESGTKPQYHPISIDDDSNQHLMTDNNQSSTDISSDVNCSNIGDNNVVMQDVLATVG